VGQPGWLRLVREPLVGEAGWLLPAALLGIPLVLAVLGRPWPLKDQHLALVLWAGWLLPSVLYFSLNSGLWHAYYLSMLGPPLAALVGATVWALWRLVRRWPLAGLATLGLIAGLTLWVQVYALREHADYRAGVLVVALALLLGGLALLGWAGRYRRQTLARAGLGLGILSLAVGPTLWSGLTALNKNPKLALPRSGPDTGRPGPMAATLSPAQEAILDYLLDHTEAGEYLVAGPSSHDVSGYIIETGRAALPVGGFTGRDEVVTVEGLAEMVAEGELRYVLGGPELDRSKPAMGRWLRRMCRGVDVPGLPRLGPGQRLVLFDCGG
jgi:4-amino-4-deoxy-L-arabinose transferase-like glycosyltransferase